MRKIFLIAIFLAFLFPAMPSLAASSGGAGEYVAAQSSASKVLYKGNPKTKKYHNNRCKHFDDPGVSVTFKSLDGARKQGYVPCKKCGG